MTAFARALSPQIDPVAVFIARAEARALLYCACEIDDIPTAVDPLQEAAVESGLVDQLGQDEVQAILSRAFQRCHS
jgi:hypothetical protein